MSDCNLASEKLSFIIDIFIHVIILFVFLTFLFNFVISKVMVGVFKDEVDHIIHDTMGKELKNNFSKLDENTKQMMRKLDLSLLQEEYKKPSKHIEVHNRWITNVSYAVGITFILMVIIMYVLLKYSCNTCLPLWQILKQNMIVFLFVGAVEFLFFQKIAMKFIPSPPSLMVNTFINRLKEQFK